MRIWDLPPKVLCRNHLLGEHRELHALWSILSLNKKGYSKHPETLRWVGKRKALFKRHELLVAEFKKRGYQHHSDLELAHATGKSTQNHYLHSLQEQKKILLHKSCECFKNNKKHFDYNADYKKINFRQNPHLYQIGKGEQGVLLVEPYKSEILPHWRFKTPQTARKSAEKIFQMFLEYKKVLDFVGMDMTRKFLQMGYTRSRRYANHRSGKKYTNNGTTVLPYEKDRFSNEKAKSADIFNVFYKKVIKDKMYLKLKSQHKN